MTHPHKLSRSLLIITTIIAAWLGTSPASAQQLPNSGFETWKSSCGSTEAFGTGKSGNSSASGEMRQRPGQEPESWNGSSVNQKVIMEKKETLVSKNGEYVQLENKFVGVMSIGSNAPGFMNLGTPWVYAESTVSNCDGGTYGGYSFKFRPDAIATRVKRTDSNDENSYIVAYLWSGTFQSKVGKAGSPTQTRDNVDRAIFGKITPDQAGKTIALLENTFKTTNGDFTDIISEFDYKSTAPSDLPEYINVIISAGDYWTRGNLVAGTTLLVDNVRLIYYSRLESLSVNGKAVAGFSPGKYSYTIDSYLDTEPKIDYELLGGGKSASVTTNTDPAEATITVTVTGIDDDTDGEKSHIYTLQYKRPASTLESLTVGGKTFSPVDGTINTGMTWSELTKDNLNLTSAASEATFEHHTDNADYPYTIITVTNTDASPASHTYTVNFIHSTAIAGIRIDGAPFPVGADGTTIDATSRELPLPDVSAISIVPADKSTGTPTLTKWNADTETSVATFTVTNGLAEPTDYTVRFPAPVISRLRDIRVRTADGSLAAWSAPFDSKTYEYERVRTFLPEESAFEFDYFDGPKPEVTISFTDTDSDAPTALITVKGNGKDYDGLTEHTYRLPFNKRSAILRSSSLASVTIDGNPVEGFSPTKLDYTIASPLPADSDSFAWTFHEPEYTDETDGTKKTLSAEGTVCEVVMDPVKATAILTVSNEYPDNNGAKVHTYRLQFLPYYSRALSITANGQTVATLDLTDLQIRFNGKMPAADGITVTLPEATAGEITSSMTQDADKAVTTLTLSNSQPDTDGLAEHTYTLRFEMPHFSRLALLAINGAAVEGFAPTTYAYTIPTVMPDDLNISAVAMTGGQGEPTVGDPIVDRINATVTVTVTNSEADTDGLDTHTYTIRYTPVLTALLSSIAIGGTEIEGFNQDKFDYTIATLMPALTEITATAAPSAGNVTVGEPVAADDATVTITVSNGDLLNTYTLRFLRPCPSTLSSIKVSGTEIEGFNPDKFDYDLTSIELPADGAVAATVTDSRATAAIVRNESEATVTITVTAPVADANGATQHIYTLRFKAPSQGGEDPGPDTPPTPPEPSTGTTVYEGSLTIMMMGEDLTQGGQDATVEIDDAGDGTCTFRLPDFSLDLGDGPASLGDIVVENVTVTEAADGTKSYTGTVRGLELAEGSIVADVDLTGTTDALGNAHMVIAVNWQGIAIDVEFNGVATKLPEKPEPPVPSDGTTVYEGSLTIMMMGEDLTQGGQDATVEIDDAGDGTCTFRLPDFSLDLGDGPASLGDIVVENVTVTEAADGTKSYTGTVRGLELAEGSIVADVDLTGTTDALGNAHMVIAVNWQGIAIDVEFNGVATKLPEKPDTGWSVTEGRLTVELNGYDITEGGVEAQLNSRTETDGSLTFMLPDFRLSLDAAGEPALLGDITVGNIAQNTADGITFYSGHAEGVTLADGAITADLTLTGSHTADGLTLINVDVIWLTDDGRRIPIMARFSNHDQADAAEVTPVAYRGTLTVTADNDATQTMDVVVRFSPERAGRATLTIYGMTFSPASRAAGLGESITFRGVCVTPLGNGTTSYDGTASGVELRQGMTADATIHGLTDRDGNHSLALDLLCTDLNLHLTGRFDGTEDTSAIGRPGTERPGNGAEEWFDMKGMRVNPDNLRPGIYIRRKDGKTEKILIR